MWSQWFPGGLVGKHGAVFAPRDFRLNLLVHLGEPEMAPETTLETIHSWVASLVRLVEGGVMEACRQNDLIVSEDKFLI